jgi:hypothetical protein
MIGILLAVFTLIGFWLCTINRTQLGFSITLLCLILFYVVDLKITSLIVYAILYVFIVDMNLICYLAYLCRNVKGKV